VGIFDEPQALAKGAEDFAASEDEKRNSAIFVAGAFSQLLLPKIDREESRRLTDEEKKQHSKEMADKYAEVFLDMIGAAGYTVIKKEV
jgi:hypothetical protein